jgi:hypothetical protein
MHAQATRYIMHKQSSQIQISVLNDCVVQALVVGAYLRITDDDTGCTSSGHCYIDTPYVLFVCVMPHVACKQQSYQSFEW